MLTCLRCLRPAMFAGALLCATCAALPQQPPEPLTTIVQVTATSVPHVDDEPAEVRVNPAPAPQEIVEPDRISVSRTFKMYTETGEPGTA